MTEIKIGNTTSMGFRKSEYSGIWTFFWIPLTRLKEKDKYCTVLHQSIPLSRLSSAYHMIPSTQIIWQAESLIYGTEYESQRASPLTSSVSNESNVLCMCCVLHHHEQQL